MAWTEITYETHLDNGTFALVDGFSNGSFGVSLFDEVLTHLATGYKIAQFRDAESAMRVGDYLAEEYAAELAALNHAYRKSLTHDQFKQLPSAIHLNEAVKTDDYFQSQIKEFAILPEKKR